MQSKVNVTNGLNILYISVLLQQPILLFYVYEHDEGSGFELLEEPGKFFLFILRRAARVPSVAIKVAGYRYLTAHIDSTTVLKGNRASTTVLFSGEGLAVQHGSQQPNGPILC